MRVLILGAGKMVDAILTGLKKTEDLSEWMIYSPTGVSARNLAGKVGARPVTDLSLVKSPDWVLVGCKPQQLKELKQLIKDQFSESLFVSILAALPENDQRETLGAKELIRVMPNLPVAYNEGVTLLSSESAHGRLKSFEKLFEKLGTSMIVSEKELEELTLLTGSGPAFFYEFAHKLAESFSSLDSGLREKLVRQVLIGSAKAVNNQKETLNDMTNAVTSKGGVTIAVLESWRKQKMEDFIKEGISKGQARSEELKTLLRK